MIANNRDNSSFLKVQDLHTYYGNNHVIKGISFDIKQGESVCLLGRNGMGKTTTVRSILGLTPARSGDILISSRSWFGKPVYKIVNNGIGYVPEGRGMFPNLTVRESLIMAAHADSEGKSEWNLSRVLDLFPRLKERINHYTGNLSGGEQQMVAIGRALLLNPKLLILDEATEGLAPLIRKEVWNVIKTIKELGIATLIIDKNVNIMAEFTDKSIILVKGCIVYEGASKTLLEEPEILQKHLGV